MRSCLYHPRRRIAFSAGWTGQFYVLARNRGKTLLDALVGEGRFRGSVEVSKTYDWVGEFGVRLGEILSDHPDNVLSLDTEFSVSLPTALWF